MDVLARARALADSALFAALTADALLALAERATPRAATEGAAIGLADDEIALVVRGAVRDPNGTVITAGQPAALVRVLTGAPRGADLVAVDEAQVLALRHDDLVDVLTEQPAALRALLVVLAARLRERLS